MKTVCRIMARLGIVVGAAGLFIIGYTFVTNYKPIVHGLTEMPHWTPPATDSVADISDLPAPNPLDSLPPPAVTPGDEPLPPGATLVGHAPGGAPRCKDFYSATKGCWLPEDVLQEVVTQHQNAVSDIKFDALLFGIPAALFFALSWVVKPE